MAVNEPLTFFYRHQCERSRQHWSLLPPGATGPNFNHRVFIVSAKRVLNIARALLGNVARLIVLELEGGAKDVTEWFNQGHSELESIALLDSEEVSR
jgi:hypothetical protein